jgi:RNA polymerase sigma-70 factor (ECF subfamily)
VFLDRGTPRPLHRFCDAAVRQTVALSHEVVEFVMPSDVRDLESVRWVRELGAAGPAREAAVARLHDLLLRVARGEAARRRNTLPERGLEELDDLCAQAAGDATMAVLAKLADFRGEARVTTWACKFVILEISTRLRRHAWRHRRVETDESVWERLPDDARSALESIQDQEVIGVLDRAIRQELTGRQRSVFRAAVLDEVPIDVLAERLGSTRGAIYKTVHDARRKLRLALAAEGYGEKVS